MSRVISSQILFYTRGTSDKFYEVQLLFDGETRQRDRMWMCRACYGRRGSRLTTASWVSKGSFASSAGAIRCAVSLLNSKYAKGYTADEDGITPLDMTDDFIRVANSAIARITRSSVQSYEEARMEGGVRRAARIEHARERDLESAINNPDYDDITTRDIDMGEVD